MPLPIITFATFDLLETYIDTFIIPNALELIQGDEHNAVENGLLVFIRQSPLNWQKAKIESAGGVLSATRPVVVFITATPTSFTWPDNIYNEYVFINTTSGNIPLLAGTTYYNINLVPQNNIPAKSIVNIVKADNDLWIMGNNPASSAANSIYPFYITSTDFEPDGVSYNNAGIVGDPLSLFINEYSQQWLVASAGTFSMTATGFIINIPGFDANTQSWSIMVQKLNS